MTDLRARRWLVLIVATYVVLATVYSFATPPFEASDELWHYPMVKYLADNGLQLPLQDPAVPTAWRQEGSQPPLYYMLAAMLTSWIDTSNLDYWRRINPHADIGVIVPDGNVNMIVHRPEEAQNRFTGALLALQLSRFFSIALGAGTVIVTCLLARSLFPTRHDIALMATAFNAFLPMFLFISGSVNNDNLSNLLGNLLTLLVVRLLLRETAPSWRDYMLLGIACGAGILSKMNLGFFIPIIALSLFIISLRRRDWRPLVIGGIISGTLTIAIAGWWYLRNWQLYGDPTGLNVFLDIVGRRAIPANAAQLWSERDSFLWAFWGFFGGMNVPIQSTTLYTGFNLIGGIGLLSALLFIAYQQAKRPIPNTQYPRTFAFFAPLRLKLSLAHWITLLWIVVTFVSYLRWTAETPASQGRLVFGALSSICVWLVVGWCWWHDKTWIKAFVAAPFILVSFAAPTGSILPAYQSPLFQTPNIPQAMPNAVLRASDGGAIALTSTQQSQPTVRPGEYARVSLLLTVEQAFQRDWSLFVHLVTPDNVIVGQRDIYPGGGTLATSDLSPGQQWFNDVYVWIPPNAYAPQTLAVVVGWYHLPTGERMMTDNGEELVTIGQIDLQPRASELTVPNPININFSDQIELVGYSISDLSPAAASQTILTLYWQALDDLDTDYIVFAQVIDPLTTTIHAASDAMPAQWSAPTSTWQPGVIIEDPHILPVNAAAPPGIYEIYVGLYRRGDDGSFNRLRVFTPDGGAAFDYTQLTRVRILPSVSP